MQIDLTEQIRERYEKRLRKILKINKHLTYNKDIHFGPIGAWIINDKKGVESAIKLLVEKSAPIYIHRKYGSAVFSWDYLEQEFIIQVWYQQQLIEQSKTKNVAELKIKMEDAWKMCLKKK